MIAPLRLLLSPRRALAALGLLAWGVVPACNGDVVGGTGGAGGAGVCTPGSTTSCTCHAVSAPGTQTCLADGNGYGECTQQDGGSCVCPAGRSDGCCYGDGLCCSCIKGCDQSHEFQFPDPVGDALIACVCASAACSETCKYECDHGGIGDDCIACVKQVGMSECSAEYQACGGI